VAYQEQEETLCPGDYLVCCTDGITEAMDARWRPLDIEGVAEAARGEPGASADSVAQHVLDRAREHADSVSRDDQTIVVVRRRAPQEER
jgi:serine phosphatase RsbU (regulator of sigma subunit)